MRVPFQDLKRNDNVSDKGDVSEIRNWLPETITDRNVIQRPMYIPPVLFCAIRYVNEWIYLPGTEAPKSEKLRKERKNDVELSETWYPSSDISFRSDKLRADRPTTRHDVR